MRVRLASEAAPGHAENEDHAFQAGSLVAVLDGVTTPPGIDTGCVHGPAWYVRRLTARLTEVAAASPDGSLAEQLAEAIRRVRGDHDGRCDLDNPATPAATVCLARDAGDTLDYLVLSDGTLVVELGADVRVVTDSRFRRAVAELRQIAVAGDYDIGRAEQGARMRQTAARKHELTNTPDGYWIAAANPEAAHRAVTGSLPLAGRRRVRRAALLTDGASCAVDDYAFLTWPQLLDLLTDAGPEELIRRVRLAENADRDARAHPRYKLHDDASAALCVFDE
ncbi:Protein phosphatase 2C [Micromonospora pattaloongensis]|uniref:Protein phosphatase 2C n=1 Tax=Micromonospora pattaloongensis TaxID=405436 RepID=A0A1H3HIY3_9ACTN|nr:protein phosphatase 2C domain-containing protein [Micromonospora pattaloongensis]SDY15447.1 Protein phosphatase 2C [Micromonospora pattaloongensis]